MRKFTAVDETISLSGFQATLTVQPDDCHSPPWEEYDGHGIVSEWTRRKKMPGERILHEDRMSKLYYDFHATMNKARAEGWDAEPFTGTKGERAARAVELDFDRLRKYCRGHWNYVFVTVTVTKRGIELASCSVGGVESDADDHILEIANELICEAIAEAKSAIKSLVK